MASRKEQKEALKAERLEAERQAHVEDRRKRLAGIGVAAALVLALVAVVGIVIATGGGGSSGNAHIVNKIGFTTTGGAKPDDRLGVKTKPGPLANNLSAAAKAAGCKLTNPPDEGNKHLSANEPTPHYKSNPPTSGPHDPVPLADGAFLTTPPLRNAVHSMEHGRVEIQYPPKLPVDDQLELKGVFDESFRYMLLFPNPTVPGDVAVTAWGHLLVCPDMEAKGVLDAIRAFRDNFVTHGPEPASIQPA